MSVALQKSTWQDVYPMDYYANDSLGPWTVNNEANRPQRQRKPRIKVALEKETNSKSLSGTCCKSENSCSNSNSVRTETGSSQSCENKTGENSATNLCNEEAKR